MVCACGNHLAICTQRIETFKRAPFNMSQSGTKASRNDRSISNAIKSSNKCAPQQNPCQISSLARTNGGLICPGQMYVHNSRCCDIGRIFVIINKTSVSPERWSFRFHSKYMKGTVGRSGTSDMRVIAL